MNAVAIFLFGISASIFAVAAICLFLSQVARNQAEKKCILCTYFKWIAEKGSTEQKQEAQHLYRKHDVNGLKALVGTGMLVEE